MLEISLVRSKEELVQIHRLNSQNLKQNLSAEEKSKEGFLTWLYSLPLLEKMHSLAPSVIVKDENKVVGYSLVTLIESAAFHPDLQHMIDNLKDANYNGLPLLSYPCYIMG